MLAVDIGNTFTRVVAFDGAEISARASFLTHDLRLDQLSGAFADAAPLAGSGLVWIASVVPSANALVDAAADRAGLARRFIKPGTDFILPHRLRTPATTGVDRLLSALAAGRRHFAPGEERNGYVVIQCGSAATVDLVDGDGVFRGGYIIPGPNLWLGGLTGAAQLPDYSGEIPDWGNIAPGDNTRDAILNGMHAALPIAVATSAMLLSPGAESAGRGGGQLPVVVTGGWGETVIPYVRARTFFDRDLMLHGVRFFAEREREGGPA